MGDAQDEIEAAGGDLVVIGNGAAHFAKAFREDLDFRGTLLVDPELRAYRVAGLRRGRVEVLSPRLGWNALRALGKGHRQGAIEGDPWQLGGALVIRPGGDLAFRHVSTVAGDHADPEELIAALEPGLVPLPEGEGGSALASVARPLGRLVDPLVPLSFSRPGYAIRAAGFDPDDLVVDLGEQRWLVTGANSGIGFETALALADLGAEVELLCRNPERGAEAAERIADSTGNRRVRAHVLDVSSLADVAQVAEQLIDRPVDGIVHNAGVLPDDLIESADGLELTWATHVAGPHLLTRLLRPALDAAPAARVIFVSSGGMYTRGLETRDPDWQRRRYDGVLAYAETKRAQVVLAELWAEAFAETGVTCNSMHPGWAETPSVESSLPRFHRVTKPFLRTPAEGADTVVWLAASPAAAGETGRFFFDRRAVGTHWLLGTRESASERAWLWERCEKLAAPFVVVPSD